MGGLEEEDQVVAAAVEAAVAAAVRGEKVGEAGQVHRGQVGEAVTVTNHRRAHPGLGRAGFPVARVEAVTSRLHHGILVQVLVEAAISLLHPGTLVQALVDLLD